MRLLLVVRPDLSYLYVQSDTIHMMDAQRHKPFFRGGGKRELLADRKASTQSSLPELCLPRTAWLERSGRRSL